MPEFTKSHRRRIGLPTLSQGLESSNQLWMVRLGQVRLVKLNFRRIPISFELFGFFESADSQWTVISTRLFQKYLLQLNEPWQTLILSYLKLKAYSSSSTEHLYKFFLMRYARTQCNTSVLKHPICSLCRRSKNKLSELSSTITV